MVTDSAENVFVTCFGPFLQNGNERFILAFGKEIQSSAARRFLELNHLIGQGLECIGPCDHCYQVIRSQISSRFEFPIRRTLMGLFDILFSQALQFRGRERPSLGHHFRLSSHLLSDPENFRRVLRRLTCSISYAEETVNQRTKGSPHRIGNHFSFYPTFTFTPCSAVMVPRSWPFRPQASAASFCAAGTMTTQP